MKRDGDGLDSWGIYLIWCEPQRARMEMKRQDIEKRKKKNRKEGVGQEERERVEQKERGK